MRLFFALLPDAATCARLASFAAQLTLPPDARRVVPKNFHITVAFVGELAGHHLQAVRGIGAALRIRRCAIELDSLEYWSSSQAIVLSARDNSPELEPFTDRLRNSIQAYVPARRNEKAWRAHATLARKVAQLPVLTAMSVSWASTSFALMRSDTGGDDSVYTVVDSWSLLDNP